MDKINFVKSPYSCCLAPFTSLSFLIVAAGSIFFGFATEWDIGVRHEGDRNFYEYYSASAISGAIFMLIYFGITIVAMYCTLGCGMGCITSGCLYFMLIIYLVVFVFFGLIMDEVIKIPAYVLTIIGAVFEGIGLIFEICKLCGGKDELGKDRERSGSCVVSSIFKLVGKLMDLAMFIVWTVDLAKPSDRFPFLFVGILKIVGSVLGTIGDIIDNVSDSECSKVFTSVLIAAGSISQSILIPLRTDGHISLHYVYATMIVGIGTTALAVVTLVAGCCGYSVVIGDIKAGGEGEGKVNSAA